MPLRYGSQQNTQGENWSAPSQDMDMDERERLRNRFGNSTFWQGHDYRSHTRARGSSPPVNPFEPRPEPYMTSHQHQQSYTVGHNGPGEESHQQAGQYTSHVQQPQNNQYQLEWLDDEGYSSGGEQTLDMSRPQNDSQIGHQNTHQGSQGSYQGSPQGRYQYGHEYVPEGIHNAHQGSHRNTSESDYGRSSWTVPQSAHRSYGRNSRNSSRQGPRSSFF